MTTDFQAVMLTIIRTLLLLLMIVEILAAFTYAYSGELTVAFGKLAIFAACWLGRIWLRPNEK